VKLSDSQQDTGKQRKVFKVAGAVLVALWLVSHLPHSPQVRPVMAEKKSAPLVATPPPATPAVAVAPAAVAVVASAPLAATPAAAPDPLLNVSKTFVGTWMGRATVGQAPHARGCDLSMEVKRQDKDKEAEPFNVFLTLNCLYGSGYHARRDIASAVLGGVGQDGVVPSINFDTVINNVGVKESEFSCEVRSMKLTSFGNERISAAWQESGSEWCHGGEVVMLRRRFY